MTTDVFRTLSGRTLLSGLVLSLSILLCYFGLWNAYFFSDDFWMLGWVRHRASLSEAVWAQFGYGVRFLLDAVNWTRVRLFDLNPAPYYWISLLQHTVVTFIVYGLVALWTRRYLVAFLTALLFGTTFAHFEVITWITGSEYSLAAILYLSTLALFSFHLRRRHPGWYLASLATFVLLLLLLELALSLPLVLLASHVFLGLGQRTWRSIGWRDVRLHLPFWVLFATYLVLQFSFVRSGSSEAAVAQATYEPGLHMVSNLFYFVYLVVPPYVPGTLAYFVDPTLIQAGLVALAVAGHALAAFVFWRGSPLVRFALAFMYLSFLPYTPWQDGYAGAIRYRYLPAIGFSLLVALFGVWCHGRLRQGAKPGLRRLIPAVALALPLANIAVDQVWVRRHVENSAFRRAFVTDLLTRYGDLEAGAHLYIEVPATKYRDLADACTLVFEQAVECQAVLPGERRVEDVIGLNPDERVYWLQATPEGIRQVFPQTQ